MLDLAIKAQNSLSFPFKVVVNDQDVVQGTGNVKQIQRSVDGDNVTFSTFLSIQMQLMTGDTIGNCCSNFHKLLGAYLKNGYGTATINEFQCLQDNDNATYRVCCSWTKTQVNILPINSCFTQDTGATSCNHIFSFHLSFVKIEGMTDYHFHGWQWLIIK